MAHKFSLALLKHCNGRSLRSTTLSDRQLFVSLKAAGGSIRRKSQQIGTGSSWRMPTNKTLANEPTIEICVAQDCDRDRLLDFLRQHYYKEEPLTIGSEPKEPDEADEEFSMSMIKHGLCLMAMRRNGHEENIVGAIIAGPKDSTEYEHLQNEAKIYGPKSKWGRMVLLLARIEHDSNVFKRYGVESAVHTHAMGVDQNTRGQGIGLRLFKELAALGQKRNFPLMTVDCTSVYSARICTKLGMECVNVLRYEDHCDEHGKQAFRPPSPHEEIRTFAMRLTG